MKIKSCEIIVILTIICISQAIFISKIIPSNNQFCISQDIPRHTLVKIQIKTNANVIFQFKQGMVVLFNQQINTGILTKSVTTQRYGTHYFCFLNKGEFNTKVSMQISVGKRAKDYGSTLQGQDFIGSLKNQAKIAQEFIQQIVRQNTQGLEIILAQQQQHYSFTDLYIFSGMFGLTSIILTLLQYTAIKKYLHSRKYI